MRKINRVSLAAAALLLGAVEARTWTDTAGKVIEADLVAVEGDKVVLKFKGKEVKLPLARLSADDRKFVEEWQKNPVPDTPPAAVAPGELKLCGTILSTGGIITVVEDALPPEVLKAYSKARTKPAKFKLSIALPSGFDPAKPQNMLWVCAPINNETDRKNGNTGGMGEYTDKATKAGWVVVAVDTDVGNPHFHDDDRSKDGDMAVHRHVVSLIGKEWPASKTWNYASGGFSGGAKKAFTRAGQLLECNLSVTGLLLMGCNEDRTDEAREGTGFRKTALKKIRVFMSNGRQDDVATPEKAETVRDSLKGQGYAEVELDLFDGPHTIGQESYAKGMEWLKPQAAAKK